MTERLILRQNDRFETEFLSLDPHRPESEDFKSTANMHELTPYGLFLAGLAGCKAVALHSYAQAHGLYLDIVEVRLSYERVCDENSHKVETYTEQIEEEILLIGELDARDREILFLVSKQCPLHKIVEDGIEVHSTLVEVPLAEAA